MLRFSINSCAHGSRIAWLGRLASNQWLHAWRQHVAWHMVPRSNQLLHAMQHRLARDASLQNRRLREWQQCRLACDASLRINGCAHGGSIAWHMVPSLNQLLHANQCSIAWHGMPRFRVDSCEHGSGVAWLAMLRFESMAAHMAAASLSTQCLASNLQRHAWRQYCLAHGASLRIRCCMQCSIAWHVMSGFRPLAERMVAASLGPWSFASYQLLHAMQHRLACDASRPINSCTQGSNIAWYTVPRFVSAIAAYNAASLSTGCLASDSMAARMGAASPGT